MLRKHHLILLLSIVASLAIAACGDDDGGASSEDEDEITAAIDRAATSGEAAVCSEVQTANFNLQTSGEPGDTPEQAQKACEEDAADSVGDEVEVSNIEVDGDSATADAAVTGSIFDGQTLQIGLVKESDVWKLNEVTGFAEFDRASFDAAFKEQFSSESDVTPQQVDCVTQNIAKVSDEQVQSLFLGQDSGDIEKQVFEPCFS